MTSLGLPHGKQNVWISNHKGLVIADVVMMTIIYRLNKVILVVWDYGMGPWYNHKPDRDLCQIHEIMKLQRTSRSLHFVCQLTLKMTYPSTHKFYERDDRNRT